MIRFGFSAYLKLICLSDRQQRAELRKRRHPTDDAYDYHRSLRLRARRLLDGEPVEVVLESLRTIASSSERKSATEGLTNLVSWFNAEDRDAAHACPPAIYTSPNDLFRVTYSPDFQVDLAGRRTAVHLWNTLKPNLEANFVYGTLAMFSKLYAAGVIDDLAVLSLRDQRIYRLADIPREEYAVLGPQIAMQMERRINEVWSEDIRPSRERRPPAAPPAA